MKSIEINYLTSSGYETLYPQTSSDLVTYNSQTLTQVINQQNSEIAGLQGQVGDSEVGVTIPKVVEYHFGAGSVGQGSTVVVFQKNMTFPLGIYHITFLFNGATGQGGDLSLFTSSTVHDDVSTEIPLNDGIDTTSPISFASNLFVLGFKNYGGSPVYGIIELMSYSSSSSATSRTNWVVGSRLECSLNSSGYKFPNDWSLRCDYYKFTYSSFDIRIYYYD